MVKVTNLTFGFPKKDLYNEVCFEIVDGEHAVLIGSNGTGKSTLIELLLDREKYVYDGKIEIDSLARIGFVSQYVSHTGIGSVYDFLAEPFTELLTRADEEALKLAEADDMETAYESYQRLLDEIDSIDGYNFDSNIRKQVSLAGLSKIIDNDINQISGGEYKLLSILKQMLLKPQLLIMDEPDVFLDFENLVSLSKLINSYEGTLLVVTHNRLLLGQCFDKILHLENTELQEFPGTFAEYNLSMLETKTLMKEQASKDEEWIEIQEKLVERLRYQATMIASSKRGAQVHARASYLERLKARKASNPFLEDRSFDLHFSEAEVNPEEVAFELNDYNLAFDRKLLENVSFKIHEGEKVALVGPNGTGKSSLLNDVVSMLKTSENSIGYFSQIYDSDEMLSGGEQNISQLKALAKLDTKLLILDEPTSHLDTYAQIALEDAIREYHGTVFMVTHDFYTVANCVDRILLIEDGTIKEMSARAFRKSIYKKYFSSDIFEKEKEQKDLELRINNLLKKGNYKEAKAILGLED